MTLYGGQIFVARVCPYCILVWICKAIKKEMALLYNNFSISKEEDLCKPFTVSVHGDIHKHTHTDILYDIPVLISKCFDSEEVSSEVSLVFWQLRLIITVSLQRAKGLVTQKSWIIRT